MKTNQINHQSWRVGITRTALFTFHCLLFIALASCEAKESTHEEDTSCDRIKTVVSDDLMKQGKLSRDEVVLFLPAEDNNQALQQAQNLCVRLGAEITEEDERSTTYTLADETGKITIVDFKKEKNVFAVVFLTVNCPDLVIKEVRFISLKAYSDLEGSIL